MIASSSNYFNHNIIAYQLPMHGVLDNVPLLYCGSMVFAYLISCAIKSMKALLSPGVYNYHRGKRNNCKHTIISFAYDIIMGSKSFDFRTEKISTVVMLIECNLKK